MAIDAGGVYSKIVLDMTEWSNNLKKADGQMEQFANKMKNNGDRMEKVGKTLSLKVTAPLMAMGGIATKVGMDFEAGMSQVQAISGATGDDLARLEAKAKEMGATTKFSASESAEALKYMAMAGWDTNDMLDGLEGVMMLAAASGEDLALTSDIVTDALTAFGMEAHQAGEFADLLANASSNSNTNVAMLGESFKYVAPLFGALGYSAEDAALALGLMANAGIKGSQAGTSLRGAITNLANPTDKMADAMNKLGISITDANGEMLPFKDVMDELRDKFAGLTEEQQAQYAATIFGKEAMSGMLAIINASDEDYAKLTDATREYTGAAKEMSETMEDNLQGRITKLKSALEGLALQIFELMLPSLERFVDWLQKTVDWLSGLDEGTQRNIIKIGAMAGAIGPLLIVGGKFANGLGSMLGLLGKLSPALGTATTATSALTAPTWALGGATKASTLLLNPWVAGLALATAGGIKLAKHLKQDSIPAVNLFSDEVSESTQEAVGSFLDLEEQATKSLNQLAWSGEEVTGEMAESIIGNFEEMKEQVVGKLEEQKEGALKSISEMVEKSIDMTEEEKEEMIRITGESYDEQIKKTEEGNARIKEILETAKKENRAITEEEKNEINKIKEDMKNDGIRILSESEKEQLAIMERLKQESGKISARQAAEIVKKSKEQKEKTIAEAEEEYTERLKYAAQLRADGSEESERLADKVVEEAERQKNEATKKAEEMHENVITEAKAQAEEHVNQVDWETGEIKTKWQVMKDDIQTKAKEIKEDVISRWEEIKTSTSEKWNDIKTDVSNSWSDMKRETFEKVKDICSEMTSRWEDIYISTRENWGGIRTSVANSINNIKDKIDEGIEKIKEWNATKVKEKVFTIVEKIKRVFSGGGGGATYTSSTGSTGNNAHGTNFWRGGLTWVGEQGPELIELPKGSKVYSNQKSEEMVNSQGKGITQNIIINSPEPLNPSEIARKNLQVSRQLAMEWGV